MTITNSSYNEENPNNSLRTQSHSLKRNITAVTMGNLVEWFDFALYSSMATIVGHVFFPESSSSTQLLATYATFAAGFLIRPLGSLVFGPIGDRYGRRTALSLSITLMAVATMLIAFLPGYSSIGFYSPLLLIVLRLVQGLSTGGEYGGSCVYISESSPDKKRSFFTSWLEFGNVSGFVVGALVVNVLTYIMGTEAFTAWGWRIPFVIGGLIGLTALLMRRKLDETPVFEHMKKNHTRLAKHNKKGFIELIIKEWPELLKCMGFTAAFNVSYYVILGYLPGYLTSVIGVDNETTATLFTALTASLLVLIPISGYLADRFTNKRIMAIGCVAIAVLSLPIFYLMEHASVGMIFLLLVVLLIGQAGYHGTIPSTLTSLFAAPVRYTCLALSYNVSVSLFAGTAPLVNTWLIEKTGNPMVPAWYLIAFSIVGLITLCFTKDRTGKPLLD